ncbi:hypothetical protein FS837_003498 [Tulasnella sp. UAMH 9824]|nr:hypothetical protein FS837_003498 [Tulasnella sp. UAMH 9824]
MWSAPKSLVKILFLANRYTTLLCLAFAAWETSRLGHLSDADNGLVTVLGCFETLSLATWDLLLLFRVHALWGGRRNIVIATSALYCVTYICHAVVGLIGSAQLIPHLYFDPYARTCVTDFRPRLLSFLWCFALFSETVMFILTLTKVIEDRKSDPINNALMRSLYYGQIIYNVLNMGTNNCNRHTNDAASAEGRQHGVSPKHDDVLRRDRVQHTDRLGATRFSNGPVQHRIFARRPPGGRAPER